MARELYETIIEQRHVPNPSIMRQLLTFSEVGTAFLGPISKNQAYDWSYAGFGIADAFAVPRYISYSILDMILLALINDEGF